MLSWAFLLLQAAPSPELAPIFQRLIREHCAECHAGARPKGDLDLSAWIDGRATASSTTVRGRLEQVRDRLLFEEMPPPNRARPGDDELERSLAWLDAQLPRAEVERPTLRRLSRSEYERTVRDLFDVDFPAREFLPAADAGAMFDNDAASAAASDLDVERWIEAAERVAALALPAQAGPADAPSRAGAPRGTEFTAWMDATLASGSFESAVSKLGLRVWRRPLDAAEQARLCGLPPQGAPVRDRARTVLAALLASPHFVYRVETTRAGAALSAFELASRLSYFLWASAPDSRLLELAAGGELLDPRVQTLEIRRLLRDARSRSLVEEFAANWLGWSKLERAKPDPSLFAVADLALLRSMRQESEAFFEAMLREDRPLDEFIDADFTFVDERLAEHYGLGGVRGEGVRRVHLKDRDRGGLLGQASILTATSDPTRTSPVRRGKWILETLLGGRVPPPPPGVGTLSEPASGATPTTVREQLDLHRTREDCAGCHNRLDPLGFALEGFDAVGRRRDFDGASEVDTRATMSDGTVVDGVRELKFYLRANGSFRKSLARALFLYAVGREAGRDEARALAEEVDALPAARRTLASVVELVCKQPAFTRAGARRP